MSGDVMPGITSQESVQLHTRSWQQALLGFNNMQKIVCQIPSQVTAQADCKQSYEVSLGLLLGPNMP